MKSRTITKQTIHYQSYKVTINLTNKLMTSFSICAVIIYYRNICKTICVEYQDSLISIKANSLMIQIRPAS